MNSPSIMKQEIMFGLFFVLIAGVFSWLVFLKGPLDERSTLKSELALVENQSEAGELQVSPTEDTVLSAKSSIASLSDKDITDRISEAEQASGLRANVSIDSAGVSATVSSSSAIRKLNFLSNLRQGVSLANSGQIKNPQKVPLLKIKQIDFKPTSMKIIIEK